MTDDTLPIPDEAGAAPYAAAVADGSSSTGRAFSLGSGPFSRLARTHLAMVMGDTMVAIALAGSLFFSIDPSAARWRVALYLGLTLAPFGLVAPLIGPAIDRAPGGHRIMMILAGVARVVIAGLMTQHLATAALFPEAFAMLVIGKAYHVAKAALVPTTVGSEDALVQANSRLALLSGIGGVLGAIPGGILAYFGGPNYVVGGAAVAFGVGALLAVRIPAPPRTSGESGDSGRADPAPTPGIQMGASAMGFLRGITGFLTFLLAFELRGGAAAELGSPFGHAVRRTRAGLELAEGTPWQLGLMVALSGGGALVGAAVAPRLRDRVGEERILTGALLLAGGAAAAGVVLGGLTGAGVTALGVGVSSSVGKQAFDALVQRDAAERVRGRFFASSEARFQLIWVVGALLPVVLPIPLRLGCAMILATAGVAAAAYLSGQRALASGGPIPAVARIGHTGRRRRSERAAGGGPPWSDVAGARSGGSTSASVGTETEAPPPWLDVADAEGPLSTATAPTHGRSASERARSSASDGSFDVDDDEFWRSAGVDPSWADPGAESEQDEDASVRGRRGRRGPRGRRGRQQRPR